MGPAACKAVTKSQLEHLPVLARLGNCIACFMARKTELVRIKLHDCGVDMVVSWTLGRLKEEELFILGVQGHFEQYRQ